MSRETTTTFTIKVTHKGPKKDFLSLFKQRGSKIIDLKVNLISTATQQLPAVPKYSEEVKIVRRLLKEAIEKAGFTYGTYKQAKSGTYQLTYNVYSTRIAYSVTLFGRKGSSWISVEFESELESPGFISSYVDGLENIEISLQDPDIESKIVEYFVKAKQLIK